MLHAAALIAQKSRKEHRATRFTTAGALVRPIRTNDDRGRKNGRPMRVAFMRKASANQCRVAPPHAHTQVAPLSTRRGGSFHQEAQTPKRKANATHTHVHTCLRRQLTCKNNIIMPASKAMLSRRSSTHNADDLPQHAHKHPHTSTHAHRTYTKLTLILAQRLADQTNLLQIQRTESIHVQHGGLEARAVVLHNAQASLRELLAKCRRPAGIATTTTASTMSRARKQVDLRCTIPMNKYARGRVIGRSAYACMHAPPCAVAKRKVLGQVVRRVVDE